jgi:protoporphyrin/coproporphyrin ferrochelatase
MDLVAFTSRAATPSCSTKHGTDDWYPERLCAAIAYSAWIVYPRNMSTSPRQAVLLTAHGTVEQVEDIPGFLRNIRRGRPASPEILAEVTRRFKEIGGSPMLTITRELAGILSEQLGCPVYVGMRMWNPDIKQALEQVIADDIDQLISFPLAPQSTHVYNHVVQQIWEQLVQEYPECYTELIPVGPWGTADGLVASFSEAISETWAELTTEEQQQAALVFTAHSLPKRVLEAGDPYEIQFREMVAAIQARLGIPAEQCHIAYQSQGMDGGDWLGPDLLSTLGALVEKGQPNVVVAPVGFLCDHTEILYDLDKEAALHAKQVGVRKWLRTPSMNTRPTFVKCLVDMLSSHLASLAG